MDNHLSVNQQILEMTTIVNCQSSKYRYTSQGWKFRRKVTPFFSYERDPRFRWKVIPWS